MKYAGLLVFVVLYACGSPTQPIDVVRLNLSVSPTRSERGDTVHFVIRASNSTTGAVSLSRGCGPAVDVRIDHPDGRQSSVLQVLEGDGFFTCEAGAHRILEAGETQTLTYSWLP